MATEKINVTSIYCAIQRDQVHGAMDNEPWQKRAKRAGLTQKMLASLLGLSPNTVSRQLRGKWQTGTPKYVQFAILIWEQSSQETKDNMLDWAGRGDNERSLIKPGVKDRMRSALFEGEAMSDFIREAVEAELQRRENPND